MAERGGPAEGQRGRPASGPRGAGDEPSQRTGAGPGRVLVGIYGLFAVAATARAGVQLATKFGQAPLAYLLSALAGVIYVVATVALARSYRRLAVLCCSIELAGVLVVGTASLADPRAFPHATVWSLYGIGYGFVPLVLPVVGLWWLRRTGKPTRKPTGPAMPEPTGPAMPAAPEPPREP